MSLLSWIKEFILNIQVSKFVKETFKESRVQFGEIIIDISL